ncbi:ABC transporter ATP-binding protein [Bifidobacterium tibiigranuli]|jgi:putative spermidine/putrescine transport system ATP-binding protein|uniref:ABC transporter ATP-binding protein n=2 Tax=Bifidobacterium tibiigranuli TaxID=2172043 RepID=A0A5N6S2N5_9BIFI|nr:ABC transporter ATP-binding protein [Bifidobacterium tibiigranuli]KAE8128986.1 ABC transporter ATP-binding protein [Bifidobacterium tibiigranuli]MCI1254375.1 ABC transporter ATP-binding protein [Bifidobacterium tibiigranuli]
MATHDHEPAVGGGNVEPPGVRGYDSARDTRDIGEPGLVVEGLHKSFAGREVIKDVSLKVRAGEFVSLLGPSGCGKTTTLRMIAGFLHPDDGQVWMDSRDVTELGAERRPSAMVFQNYALWPHMTVERNVSFPLRVAKRPKEEIARRVDAALELVNLTQQRKARPARMSGGEQQRAALARALVREPSILLLDEPLSNLDAKLRERVREDIRSIQQRLHITTIMVTHDQQEAMAISDRIAVMHDGRLEQVCGPDELYAKPATENIARFIGTMSEFDQAFRQRRVVKDEHWLVRPEDIVYISADQPRDEDAACEDDQLSPNHMPVINARVVRLIPHGRYGEVVFESDGGASLVGLHSNDASPVCAGQYVRLSAKRVYHYVGNELSEVMQ